MVVPVELWEEYDALGDLIRLYHKSPYLLMLAICKYLLQPECLFRRAPGADVLGCEAIQFDTGFQLCRRWALHRPGQGSSVVMLIMPSKIHHKKALAL